MKQRLLSSAVAMFVAGSAMAQGGPVSLEGIVSSESFIFQPNYWPNPTVALMDATDIVSGPFGRFVPPENQVLGRFTDPLFSGEGRYRIELPIQPPGGRLDLNGDGKATLGVFILVAAPNLSSDSYLEQLEQDGGLTSIIRNPMTGGVESGALVLFSEDGAESFPVGKGEDGSWFTDDDPMSVLPRGWSVARMDAGGRVTFDNSPRPEINTIERAEVASPDLSALGYVEAFDALIGHLRERYAYTDFRGIDWDKTASDYRPRIADAASAGSAGDYFLALRDMALSFEDTHTVASAGFLNEAINTAKMEAEINAYGAGIGAEALVISDSDAGTAPGDRIIVSSVADGSPAAEAGWTEGTEIFEVNGARARDHLTALPLIQATGVAELQPYLRIPRFFRFPNGAEVAFEFRNPGQEVETAVMTAGDYTGFSDDLGPLPSNMPIDFTRIGDVAIVSWRNFSDHMLSKVAVLEEALKIEAETGSTGMILDLRGNGGGLVELYQVMASYFFEESAPMPEQLFDVWVFDRKAGDFVKTMMLNRSLHSPRPALAFTGPLVILIDQGCASSCEYFTQHLQKLGRATVIGQHASLGAGGFVDRIMMPESVTFQYTAARTTFLGGDEPNLEAAGVIPDIRVPVTLGTLAAVQSGADPVMDAALDVIADLSDPRRKLTAASWTWTLAVTKAQEEVSVDDPERYEVTFAEDGSYVMVADCNRITGQWALEDARLVLTAGPATMALCPEPSQGETFRRILTASNAIDFYDDHLAVVVEDDRYSVIQLDLKRAEVR